MDLEAATVRQRRLFADISFADEYGLDRFIVWGSQPTEREQTVGADRSEPEHGRTGEPGGPVNGLGQIFENAALRKAS